MQSVGPNIPGPVGQFPAFQAPPLSGRLTAGSVGSASAALIAGGLLQPSYTLEWKDAGAHRFWRIRKGNASAETGADYSEVQFFDGQQDPYIKRYDIYSNATSFDRSVPALPLPTVANPVLCPELVTSNPLLGGYSGYIMVKAVRFNALSSPGVGVAIAASPSGPANAILNQTNQQSQASANVDGTLQAGGGFIGVATSVNVANGTNVTNTTALTSLGKSESIPANWLKVGSVIRIRATLVWGTTTPAPGTLRIVARVGGVVMGQIFFPTLFANQVSGSGLDSIDVVFCGTVQTIGSSGTLEGGMAIGVITDNTPAASLGQREEIISARTINTTGALTVDLAAQWSVAHPANQVRIADIQYERHHAAATV